MRYVFVGVILLGLVSGLAIASDCGGTWSGIHSDHCSSRNADGDLTNPTVTNTTNPLTNGPSSTVYGVQEEQYATSENGLFLIDENDDYRPSSRWQVVRFDEGETWRTPVNLSTYVNNITYANGTLYVSRIYQNSSGYYFNFVARNAQTGEKRWEVTGPRAGGTDDRTDTMSRSLWYNDRLVVLTQGASGDDWYFEIKDGEIVQKETTSEHWFEIYDLAMMDGDVYGVLSDRSTDVEKIVRYDPDSDTVISNVTKTEIDNRGNSPYPIQHIVARDGQVFVNLRKGNGLNHTIFSYDANLSHEWTYTGLTTDYSGSLFAVDEDTVYLSTTDIKFNDPDISYMIAVNSSSGDERWRNDVDFNPVFTLGHGDSLIALGQGSAYIMSKEDGHIERKINGDNIQRAMVEGDTVHFDRETTITTYDSTVQIFYNNRELYTNELVGTEDGVEST